MKYSNHFIQFLLLIFLSAVSHNSALAMNYENRLESKNIEDHRRPRPPESLFKKITSFIEMKIRNARNISVMVYDDIIYSLNSKNLTFEEKVTELSKFYQKQLNNSEQKILADLMRIEHQNSLDKETKEFIRDFFKRNPYDGPVEDYNRFSKKQVDPYSYRRFSAD